MELAEKIREYEILPHEIMVSFDVVSLFTKIPVQLAIDTARSNLENDPTLKERTVWSVDDICERLHICLSATCLTFRGEYYQQIFGTAMGSPILVVLPNLVMENVEERAISLYHTPPII